MMIINNHLLTIFLLLSSICFISCTDGKGSGPLGFESEKVLDSIPSGSGLVIAGDTAYIIGDDGTGIYLLNLQTYSQQKMAVFGLDYRQYREPKETKHDFESATIVSRNGNQYLLAFGSGSQISARDSLLIYNLNDASDNSIVSLTQFYDDLQNVTSIDSLQWNIEGASVMGKSLILCNRGNNLVIELELDALLNYFFDSGAAFPKTLFHRVRLPRIDNKEARLSGACALNDSVLIFSASVEDTYDWTKDGPIIGSYICIYSIKEFELTDTILLKNKDGDPLKEKIESVDILNRNSKGPVTLLAIADNDNGSSKLFRLQLPDF